MAISDKEVLSMEEAAQFLGVTPFMIWDYARRWIIPGKKVGKEWQFEKSDLLWLLEKKVDQ
jgi:hypothetical protein